MTAPVEPGGTGKVDFAGVQWTMLVTLYMRSTDYKSKRPILGDRYAAEAVERIDYNWGSVWMKMSNGDRYTVALRAKQLDDWATAFLAEHPDATVLQLACGLDSRAFRLDLPPGVRWFDVDLPDVIALRRKLYADHEDYTMIASSVTEEAWLDRIPADKPTLIIAEGLLMYLAEPDVRVLLARITERFPSGEVIFDGLKPWVIWVTNHLAGPLKSFRMSWAARDGETARALEPRLEFRESASVTDRAELVPSPLYRGLYRAMRPVKALADSLQVFRYEF